MVHRIRGFEQVGAPVFGEPWYESGVVGPIASGRHVYRGTSLIRNRPLLGPYSRTMPKVIQ